MLKSLWNIWKKLYNSIVKTKFDRNVEKSIYYTSAGDNREKVPPVPISNTEVKLLIVENTWLETVRKDRTLPVHLWKHPKGCFFYAFLQCSICAVKKTARKHPLAFRSPEITDFALLKFRSTEQNFLTLALKNIASAPMKTHERVFFLCLFAMFYLCRKKKRHASIRLLSGQPIKKKNEPE